MNASYDVRVGAIQTRYKTDKNGKRVPKHYAVRWRVGGERFEKTFPKRAQTDSFRSDLMSAARAGEAFDSESGLPMSNGRRTESRTWYELACSYVDMKWDGSSPSSRSSTADSLVPITRAMLRNVGGRPDEQVISQALRRAFNKTQRDKEQPESIANAMRWIARNTRPVGDLAKPDVLRSVLAQIERKANGDRAAHDTIRLRRLALSNALDYAVERNVLVENPLGKVKTKKHRTVLKQVDVRSVVNPVQARTLLRAVGEDSPKLYAFFALMYFAALRPEEAVNLRKHNLSLPDAGLGEIHLETAAPDTGTAWTDSGQTREERGLKHRVEGAGRTVPCTDELTAILHWHIERHGTTADGRLFRAVRSDGLLSSSVYGRAWTRAREAVFTREVVESPLAKRPYDLRHAAVSTWLNATGSDAVRVAEWAGHSVSVLLRVYAKCIDGTETAAREQIARALKGL